MRASPQNHVVKSAAWALACCLCGLGYWPLAAQAQVFKCTDPATGKITYTNQNCGKGRAEVLLPEPSPEERARMEADAQRARQQRQWRQEQEYLDALRRQQAQAATPPPAPAPRNQSLECALARKEADFRASSNAGDAQQQAAQWNVAYACDAPASAAAISEAGCASARKELLFRAASNSTTTQGLQTARATAAAACGAPLPPVVIVETVPAAPMLYPPRPYYPHWCAYGRCRPHHAPRRPGLRLELNVR